MESSPNRVNAPGPLAVFGLWRVCSPVAYVFSSGLRHGDIMMKAFGLWRVRLRGRPYFRISGTGLRACNPNPLFSSSVVQASSARRSRWRRTTAHTAGNARHVYTGPPELQHSHSERVCPSWVLRAPHRAGSHRYAIWPLSQGQLQPAHAVCHAMQPFGELLGLICGNI